MFRTKNEYMLYFWTERNLTFGTVWKYVPTARILGTLLTIYNENSESVASMMCKFSNREFHFPRIDCLANALVFW